MRRVIKWLFWVLIVTAALCILVVYNPNLVRTPLENYLGNLTGYSISLDGDLAFNPGSVTTVSVINASVSSVILPGQDELLGLGRLELALRTSSLFKETIIIERIHIEEAKLNIAFDAEEQGNWQRSPPPPKTKQSNEPGKNVRVKDIRISSSMIEYNHASRQLKHSLSIDDFHSAQGLDGMVESVLEGHLNERVVNLSNRIGPYTSLQTGRNIDFDIEGDVGSLSIQGNGRLDDMFRPHRPDFKLSLKGSNTDEITTMLRLDDFGTGSFNLNISSTKEDDGVTAAIQGTVGDVSVDISATAHSLSAYELFAVRLGASGPNLGAVMRSAGLDNWPDEPFDIDARMKRSGKLFDINSAELNVAGIRSSLNVNLRDFPHLSDGRADIHIKGENIQQFQDLLHLPNHVTGNFTLLGKLDLAEDGRNTVDLELVTGLAQVSLSGLLGKAPSYIGSHFDLQANGDHLGRLVSAAGLDGFPEQPFRLDSKAHLDDEGLQISDGRFELADDIKLRLAGLVTLEPGMTGSRLNLDVTGNNLSRLLEGLPVQAQIPGGPYQLKGQVSRVEEGLTLDGVTASLDKLMIHTKGLLTFQERLEDTRIDFNLEHPDISELTRFGVPNDVLGYLRPGQSLQGSGQLVRTNEGWSLSGVTTRLGSTGFDFDAQLASSPALGESFIDFHLQGTDSHQLVAERFASRLAGGRFRIKGRLSLQPSALLLVLREANTERIQANVNLALDWPVKDKPSFDFDIDAKGKDISMLNAPGRAFQLAPGPFEIKTVGSFRQQLTLDNFDAAIGNLQFKMDGKASSLDSDSAASIRLSGNTDDISNLGSFNGEPLPALPLQIRTDIRSENQLFTFNNLSIQSGESDIRAKASIDLSGAKPGLHLDANAQMLDLRPFQQEPVSPEPAAAPMKRLIPDVQLPLDKLRIMDAGIKLFVKELRLENASYQDLAFNSQLKEGGLHIDEFRFNAPRGHMTASLSLEPLDSDSASVEIDISTTDFSLNISGLNTGEHKEVPLINAKIHLNGTGAHLRQVAANSNGYASIKSQGGVLENVDLSALEFFILDEVLSLVMPKTDTVKGTYLNCAAAFMKIEDGMLVTEPAVTFITDKLTVISSGTIDLETEGIRFNFNATPNNALKISAGELFNPYILVKGTLAQPAVGLDPTKTLIHGGAAVGTAGLSILAKGLWDRVSNTRPLCEEMLKTDYPVKEKN